MFPSTVMRRSFDDRVLDDDKMLAIPHHGLLDVAGPVVKPAAAENLDRPLDRLMGDIGALNHLVATLRERLQASGVKVGSVARSEDRPRHAYSRYTVAIDNASERLVDLHMEVAAMIVALSQ